MNLKELFKFNFKNKNYYKHIFILLQQIIHAYNIISFHYKELRENINQNSVLIDINNYNTYHFL